MEQLKAIMEYIKAIVDYALDKANTYESYLVQNYHAMTSASYTFNDVVWYCWGTAMVVTVLCLAWHEFTSDAEEQDSRRKMIR